ncbi:MAG: DUF4388 domain-containing protein [Acidobacteriota bacterium]
MQRSLVISTVQPQFDLRGESVAPFFKELCARGRTGVLTVRVEDRVRSILLHQGRPVFARSNDREDRLNGYLLRLGLVTLPDLIWAVDRMMKENRRLGEVLVDMGVLEKDRLADALRLQIREIICGLLSAAQGTFTFRKQAVSPPTGIGFSLPANALIRESLLRIQAFHRVLDEIGGLSAVYQLTEHQQEEIRTSGLSPEQADLVPLLDRPINLEQVCAASKLNDFDVCRLIWILLTIGAACRLE